MSFLTLLIISIALSVDSFIVSVSKGLTNTKVKSIEYAVTVAFYFSVIQTLMAYLGYLFGDGLLFIIHNFASIITFLIFSTLGVLMIKEALSKNEESTEEDTITPLLQNKIKNTFLSKYSQHIALISAGIATSIDSLGMGFTFSVNDTNILMALVIIAVVTFLFSSTGVLLARLVSERFQKVTHIIGGTLLLLLAIKELPAILGYV